MRKVFIFLGLGLIATQTVQAQVDEKTRKVLKEAASLQSIKKIDSVQDWQKGGSLTLNAAQSSVDNWSGGGNNAISANFFANLFANYAKGKHTWFNTLSLQYGYVKADDAIGKKSADMIDFQSLYGYNVNPNIDVSGLVRLRSQMTKSNVYKKDAQGKEFVSGYSSTLFAPAYLTVAPGISYNPAKDLKIFISPVSSRGVFVMNDSLSQIGAFGVAPNKKSIFQFGAYLNAGYKTEIIKNVIYTGNLELYSNYLKNPQNIYVLMNNALNIRIAKYITLTANYNIAYDDLYRPVPGQGPRLQTQTLYGAGLTYNF